MFHAEHDQSLRVAKKLELASRVAEDEQEFVDLLMSIDDENAIEEFFNKCHGENGRFCGGPGGKGGPGTRRPAPINYIGTRIKTAISTHKGKVRSESVNRVTTGAVRRVLSLIIPTSTAYGSVKVKKLSKTNLRSFTDKDLGTVKKALMTDQRRYNLMHTSMWAYVGIAAAHGARNAGTLGGPGGAAAGAVGGLLGASVGLGLARWKTKRIPGQISRIDRQLKARESGGGSLSLEEIITFASNESFPTLAQEIAQAKKDIEDGNIPKDLSKPSDDDIAEMGQVIDALEVDEEEGITAEMIQSLKETFKALKK